MRVSGRLLVNWSASLRVWSHGWGPNSDMALGTFVPGTRRHPMTYYGILTKKPNQAYGLQGTNHLLPQKGIVAHPRPVKVSLEKDKVYAWCACGHSHRQPYCDGSHARRNVKTNCKPVRYIPHEDMTVWLCQCKQTNNRPFCDGSHRRIEKERKLTIEEIKGSAATS